MSINTFCTIIKIIGSFTITWFTIYITFFIQTIFFIKIITIWYYIITCVFSAFTNKIIIISTSYTIIIIICWSFITSFAIFVTFFIYFFYWIKIISIRFNIITIIISLNFVITINTCFTIMYFFISSNCTSFTKLITRFHHFFPIWNII